MSDTPNPEATTPCLSESGQNDRRDAVPRPTVQVTELGNRPPASWATPQSDESRLRLLRQVASPEELLFGWASVVLRAPYRQVDKIEVGHADGTRSSVPGSPGV
jgi:hypothetical protein